MRMPQCRDATLDELNQALADMGGGESAPMSRWLRGHLREHVLSFWEPLWREPENGLPTCVSDDGQIVSEDRWLWSQWRAVWVCARLYQTIDRREIWLDRARAVATFCLKHGWLENEQGWALLLDQRGRVIRGHESVYVDAFAVYGLSELASATGDARWLDVARQTADSALKRLSGRADHLPHFPYPIPAGHAAHGVPMIWSLKFAALAMAGGGDRYAGAARALVGQVWREFHDVGENRILETVRIGGGRGGGAAGEVTVPGHVIEGLWFQRQIATSLSGGLASECSEPGVLWPLMRRHWDPGWDPGGGGGLLLAVSADATPAAPDGWAFADSKLWWPHTEALFAALFAWHESGEHDWLERYGNLWRFCAEHFVDWARGEWRQKLSRDLRPFSGTVALPVKDPFHLPRSLIFQIELLETKTPPRVTAGSCKAE